MNVFLQTCAIASQRSLRQAFSKKIPEATVFPVLFYNRRPLPDAGVFHVNVFSSSYIVLYCICFILPAVGRAFTFPQPNRQWLRLYWQRYLRQSPSH